MKSYLLSLIAAAILGQGHVVISYPVAGQQLHHQLDVPVWYAVDGPVRGDGTDDEPDGVAVRRDRGRGVPAGLARGPPPQPHIHQPVSGHRARQLFPAHGARLRNQRTPRHALPWHRLPDQRVAARGITPKKDDLATIQIVQAQKHGAILNNS